MSREEMTDHTIVNMCLEQTSSHSTKEDILSQEVTASSMPPKMRLSAPMGSAFTYDAAAATRWPKLVNLDVSLENIYGIRNAKFYMFFVDFDQPWRLHTCGLFGPLCHANSGIVFCCDDIIAADANGPLPVDQFQYKKTVSVSIREQSIKQALANFNKFVSLTDHTDFMQLAGFGEGQLVPEMSTSHFVRIMCVCLYQLVAPPGDPALAARWHRIEAMSEAFVYRPSCPRVEALHPMEFTFNNDQNERYNAPFNLVVRLNRKLIVDYDQLRGAKLELTADGTELPIDNRDIVVTEEQDRVNLDLRDCLDAACRRLPRLPDRFQARVRLLGVTGNTDWCGALSDDVIFVQLPWQQQPLPSRPPSKQERQQRSYNDEDEDADEDAFDALRMQ